MHLILCVDERDGISFCNRRLSTDRVLTNRILQLVFGNKLWVHPRSENLFPAGTVFADQDILSKAGWGEFCFWEFGNLPASIEGLESVTLFSWNRHYPATEFFPRKLLENMHLIESEELPGNSHQTITMERYQL